MLCAFPELPTRDLAGARPASSKAKGRMLAITKVATANLEQANRRDAAIHVPVVQR